MQIENVFHVISRLERGGAENQLRDLTSGQTKYLRKVAIIVLNFVDYDFANSFHPSVRIIDLSSLGFVKKVYKVRKLCSRHSLSILHAHLPVAELFVAIIPFLPNSCRVTTRHVGGNFVHRFSNNYFLIVSRFTLWRIRNVIAISSVVLESVLQVEKLKGLNVQKIHYGFDKASWLKIAEIGQSRHPRNENSVRLICVSRLEEQKRVQDLLISFRSAVVQVPNLELIILGDGRLMQDYVRWVKDNGLDEKIFLLGKTDNVAVEMKCADILVHPSEYEGFGLVYLEAVASRLPIIASAQETSIEVLGKEMFWGYETGDTNRLTELIVLVSKLDHKSWKLDFKKYESTLKRFSLEECSIATIDFYKKCRLRVKS